MLCSLFERLYSHLVPVEQWFSTFTVWNTIKVFPKLPHACIYSFHIPLKVYKLQEDSYLIDEKLLIYYYILGRTFCYYYYHFLLIIIYKYFSQKWSTFSQCFRLEKEEITLINIRLQNMTLYSYRGVLMHRTIA